MSVDTVMDEMAGTVAPGETGLTLPEGVELRRVGGRLTLMADGMELAEDFREMLPRLRPDRLGRELLVKAVRVRGVEEIRVFDATAGLGEDSMLLAAAGFSVTMCESDPVIAALLADGLRRAVDDPMLSGIVGRMSLVEGDSIEIIPSLAEAPDVVYLDPMFPARTKSAAVKKKFQLLHRLESPCADEASLMDAALAARPRKIVVKRPIKAPVLAGVRPSHSISGKAVRYDVIVPA
ncbi:MAG: class I SAM-dependent methyltransferase [Parolsenella sp.]|uniref:class I SAM-dependent methyltransferase n=1 Tax=Parolsenella sp. TaxID=2083006 RepID=UPI002E79DC64|nr:class I SAM-dependent methyltransferase [Parolsenella sp.]MEE1372617.1 class I SAM-dependent methyltransferase [Parolsenella sp.]